jgi:alpha-D-ribose 1-methylphosphonate 5-triphosphate synthase subunit PhnG
MTLSTTTEQHQRWITALAFAGGDMLEDGWAALEPKPEYSLLRPVEIGMTLLRGRIAGSGPTFNFGEATITRAAVGLASGERGIAYLLGRRPREAELAALFHALLQHPAHRGVIEERVIRVSDAARCHALDAERAATIATRVDFSTLVRGDG